MTQLPLPAKSVLMVGTAPVGNVQKCILDFRKIFADHAMHALVKNPTAFDTVSDITSHPYTGSIHWCSPSLFLLFRRLRPTRVVIACNTSYFHDNVLKAVLMWSRLCRHEPKISVFIENCLLFDYFRGLIDQAYVDF